MIKLILEITRNNSYKYRKPERSPQKPLRISCQSILILRKIFGNFYAKSCEKYMEFEENNEEFEGIMTRNLKKKHREFFYWGTVDRTSSQYLEYYKKYSLF
jgi:hypothetical protein